MLDYVPPVYFWIAEYADKTALSQFDPATGEENRFSLVDHRRLVRFGWYPFSFKLALKIHKKSGLLTVPTNNPVHKVQLNDGEKIVAKRETIVKVYDFHECKECGFRWQFTNTKRDPLVGLPVSNEAFVEHIPIQDEKGKRKIKYVSAICPNCGYHDCNAVMIPDKKIKQFSGEKRETVYILGKVGGKVLRISEDGSVER